jgi:hypothetical protein
VKLTDADREIIGATVSATPLNELKIALYRAGMAAMAERCARIAEDRAIARADAATFPHLTDKALDAEDDAIAAAIRALAKP